MYHVWSLFFHTGGSQGIMPSGAFGAFFFKELLWGREGVGTHIPKLIIFPL